MIPKHHFRCLCDRIFAYLGPPNLQNIQKTQISLSGTCDCVEYCTAVLQYTHCRTAVRAAAGASVGASDSSVEPQSIANARPRAVASAIDRNSQLANPSAQLPRGTERSRCSGSHWGRGNPGSAPQIPVWAGCWQRSVQQYRQGL